VRVRRRRAAPGEAARNEAYYAGSVKEINHKKRGKRDICIQEEVPKLLEKKYRSRPA